MQLFDQIEAIINSCESIIPEDGCKEVRHFFSHGEYEMAFEGLLLELMKSNSKPRNFDFDEWCRIARALNLDTEPNFDGDFWEQFQQWGRA
jgi:hypothetical protein